jgi:hypothetical protein
MGSKQGYAGAILEVLGLRSGQGAESFLWCEPDDGCRALLQAYPQPDILREAAEIIRSWAEEDPRALWERLRAEGPIRGCSGAEVARWARIVTSNRLINLDPETWKNTGAGGSTHGGDDFSTGAEDLARGFEGVSAREVGRFALVTGQSVEKRPTGAYWFTRPNGEGQKSADGYAQDFDTLTPGWPPVTVCSDAREVDPGQLPEGTVAYMDPPYQGTTGYGHDLDRDAVVALARRWADAGAVVCISEAEPIEALGWHHVEITGCRKGQRRTFGGTHEWLTLNREPCWRPSVTLDLFGD